MTLPIKIKKLYPKAKTPTYAKQGDGCFDIFPILPDGDSVIVDGIAPTIFSTGLSFEIPETHVMLVFSRSGHGFKHDTRLANCVGAIDAGYRGELKVKLTRDDEFGSMLINEGDAIAQAVIIERPVIEFIEVDELSVSDRGEGGFGHTDKRGLNDNNLTEKLAS